MKREEHVEALVVKQRGEERDGPRIGLEGGREGWVSDRQGRGPMGRKGKRSQ